MRVICIDAKDGNHKVASKLLKEGQVYVVVAENDDDGYILQGIKMPEGVGGFYKRRLVPLSEIDETEMERSYGKQHA